MVWILEQADEIVSSVIRGGDILKLNMILKLSCVIVYSLLLVTTSQARELKGSVFDKLFASVKSSEEDFSGIPAT